MPSREGAIEEESSFFRNTSCPYFPCHAGVDPNEFNCLFCYCPLYALGPACGGNYRYTTGGIKDCTDCTALHRGDGGVAIVREHFAQLADLARVTGDDTTTNQPAPEEATA